MINFVEIHNNIFFLLHGMAYTSSWFDFLVYLFAERIDGYVVLFGILFILLHTHKHRENISRLLSRRSLAEGLYVILGILLSWGISYLMKEGFSFPRPFIKFPEVLPLFLYGGYDSFPSGHSTLFASLATSIFLYHKRVGIFFVIAAILIGISRIVAGVHFPIDVVTGWLLGMTVSLLVYKFLVDKK